MSLKRCEDCPVDDLAYVRSTSRAGRLLDRVLALDFSVKHFRLSWSEVTVEEMSGLQVLEQERNNKQIEDQKSEQEKAEEKFRADQSQSRGGGRFG